MAMTDELVIWNAAVPLRPAAVSGAAAALRAAGVQVLHITGSGNTVEVPDGGPADALYVVIPYVDEMQYAYAAADFVMCRSGR